MLYASGLGVPLDHAETARLFAEPVDAVAAATVRAQAFPNVAADRIEADVATLIGDLAGHGLIESPESDRV